MQTIDALSSTLKTYLNPDQTDNVRRAYFFAEQAHYGQRGRERGQNGVADSAGGAGPKHASRRITAPGGYNRGHPQSIWAGS